MKECDSLYLLTWLDGVLLAAAAALVTVAGYAMTVAVATYGIRGANGDLLVCCGAVLVSGALIGAVFGQWRNAERRSRFVIGLGTALLLAVGLAWYLSRLQSPLTGLNHPGPWLFGLTGGEARLTLAQLGPEMAGVAFWGWCWGTAAAWTGRTAGRTWAVLVLLTIPLAATSFLGVGLMSFCAPERWMSWYDCQPLFRNLVLIWVGLGWLLLVLVAATQFRAAQCNWRRLGVLGGGWVVLALAVWGAAVGYYQWQGRRVLAEAPPEPALTAEETATLALFESYLAAKKQWEAVAYEPLEPVIWEDGGMPVPSRQRGTYPTIGVARWLPRPGDAPASASGMVPMPMMPPAVADDAYRAEAFAMDASPETAAMFAAIEALLSRERLTFTEGSPEISRLSALRSMAQCLKGRAQLRHWQGDVADMLYQLDQGLRLGEVWPGDASVIGQLVRVAIDQIAVSGIVSLGPDGPEYVDLYREWLRRVMARHYDQVGDARSTLAMLSAHLAWRGQVTMAAPESTWRRVLLQPLLLRMVLRWYEQSFEAQMTHEAARRKLAAGVAAYPGELSPDNRASNSLLVGEATMRTALALKLFRSLHGRYPEDLSELTPAILPTLPLDPMTGRPLVYEKDGDAFQLSRVGPPHTKLDSRPSY